MSVAKPVAAPGFLLQSATVTIDLLTLIGLVLCVPFVVLIVATPVALVAALVVWIIGRL